MRVLLIDRNVNENKQHNEIGVSLTERQTTNSKYRAKTLQLYTKIREFDPDIVHGRTPWYSYLLSL